jgi:FecR protein
MKCTSTVAVVFLAILFFGVVASPATADESHARIVRLSLVQGDVRFTQHYHADSLTDNKAGWEVAPLNLPLRQGFAIATGGDGRAEIEFENGAMAFLNGNTVMEFYDLSLYDGAVITRLVLRQGSGIFYVQPARGDYFSVTGGDFSVEADGRARFRLDNFDNGSNLNVEMGHVNVLRKEESKSLTKGQSYSVNVNEGANGIVARAPDSDDFDKWVSGRIDSVATATAYASQYVNSPVYSSGFADLYNYGSWYNLPGYGFGWQPFGMGIGWCPFSAGSWYYDSFFGWNFIGGAPWGWLPYHYGGWVFSPSHGWVWVPSGFGVVGRLPYRPVTGVWVHSAASVGLVPLHPTDGHGRAPANLGRGIYALNGNMVTPTLLQATGEKWSVEKNPPRNMLEASKFATTAAPKRVSRTMVSSAPGNRPVPLGRGSSIVYDAGQHRFVNSNAPTKVNAEAVADSGKPVGQEGKAATTEARASSGNLPAASRGTVPARPNITPPHPTTTYGGSAVGGTTWSGHGSRSSAASSAGSSTHSSGSSGGHH